MHAVSRPTTLPAAVVVLVLVVVLVVATGAAGARADPADEALLRQVVAEVATAQVKDLDPAWSEPQRDCAGLVRFAYRTAYARLRPQTRGAPLFTDERGRPSAFADAETLVGRSFLPLGRGDEAKRALRSGDLLAFRTEQGDGEVVWHLMLAIVPAPGLEARVVYHPGTAGARVRTGTLAALARQAPLEWRPVIENPSFLGFFRFRDFGSSAPGGPT